MGSPDQASERYVPKADPCSRCGYSLKDLGLNGKCPECGTPFGGSRKQHALDPQWMDGPQECIGCGYSLEGLAVPGLCPECGAPFDAQVMVLQGIPRSAAGTPMWRRVVWASLCVGLFVVVQGLGLWIMISWVIPVVGFVAILCVGAYMVATGPRERRGTERFMFTTAGVARLPSKREANAPKLDAVLIPYSSRGTLRLDRVSDVWRRLRIYVPDSHGVRQVVFDAGIRCPSEHVPRVTETIQNAMMGRVATTADASQPPPIPLHPPLAPG